MLLAPSNPLLPPPHVGSSTEGLAEPAWEAIGKVQTATPTGWWRPHRKGRVGGGWFRLNRSYIQPLPPAVRAGIEPSWLWDCDTRYSSVKPFGNWPSQATDPTPGLGWVLGTQTCPRQVSGTGKDLTNYEAESAPYLRGQRKGRGGLGKSTEDGSV